MIYILLILVIIQTAVFGYILWDLKIDFEVLEEYLCETIADLKTEIRILKKKKEETDGDN